MEKREDVEKVQVHFQKLSKINHFFVLFALKISNLKCHLEKRGNFQKVIFSIRSARSYITISRLRIAENQNCKQS